MTNESIREAAGKLRRKYGVLPPKQLCKCIDACLCPLPLGEGDNALKGFVQRCSRVCTIVVNSDQPEKLQAIVTYHEIGHIVLRHYETTKGLCRFHEYSLFDNRSRKEDEANMFVAEYLLDDETTMEKLRVYRDVFSAAASLRVPSEILVYKLRMLKYYGLLADEIPVTVNSKCMGQIQFDGRDGEDYA